MNNCVNFQRQMEKAQENFSQMSLRKASEPLTGAQWPLPNHAQVPRRTPSPWSQGSSQSEREPQHPSTRPTRANSPEKRPGVSLTVRQAQYALSVHVSHIPHRASWTDIAAAFQKIGPTTRVYQKQNTTWAHVHFTEISHVEDAMTAAAAGLIRVCGQRVRVSRRRKGRQAQKLLTAAATESKAPSNDGAPHVRDLKVVRRRRRQRRNSFDSAASSTSASTQSSASTNAAASSFNSTATSLSLFSHSFAEKQQPVDENASPLSRTLFSQRLRLFNVQNLSIAA
uniref:RRM domain-containing protein n=1 Tax=Lotharella oceanica TaxID=641309 RepID=A0A7S2TLQ4_9EUKA|eukprot:CAMPEP_0170183054 /NCGR_PEP_ID=MMETSP0040_2-20121228/29455_1 /TAXON_ID=641309 /ORGANISM="Lotharella oceanica, Strain CCMP622" /LENGTH=282 /DNA_ID=CAMNT_0010428661 /DNA_START=37 /DNA_END=885 /DNA_ORIENTATION=-